MFIFRLFIGLLGRPLSVCEINPNKNSKNNPKNQPKNKAKIKPKNKPKDH